MPFAVACSGSQQAQEQPPAYLQGLLRESWLDLRARLSRYGAKHTGLSLSIEGEVGRGLLYLEGSRGFPWYPEAGRSQITALSLAGPSDVNTPGQTLKQCLQKAWVGM